MTSSYCLKDYFSVTNFLNFFFEFLIFRFVAALTEKFDEIWFLAINST